MSNDWAEGYGGKSLLELLFSTQLSAEYQLGYRDGWFAGFRAALNITQDEKAKNAEKEKG